MKTSAFVLASALALASALPQQLRSSAAPSFTQSAGAAQSSSPAQSGSPSLQSGSPSQSGSPAQSANPAQISQAVIDWQDDTGVVSSFLNQAAALDFSSNSDYQQAARNALEAENNELLHKKVLDAQLPQSSSISDANSVLVTQGTFQSVVNLLQSLTSENIDTSAGKANIQNFVNDINFGQNGNQESGRCKGVLPAITQYFSAAAEIDNSLFGFQALAPSACSSGPIQPVVLSQESASASAAAPSGSVLPGAAPSASALPGVASSEPSASASALPGANN